MDLANLGKLLDEWKSCRVVYFNTTQNDGVIAQVDLCVEHSEVKARGYKSDSSQDEPRGNKPTRYGKVNLFTLDMFALLPMP